MKKIILLSLSLCFFNSSIYAQEKTPSAPNTWTKIAEPTRMAEMVHYLFAHPQGLFARSVLNRVLKYNPQEKKWENFDEGLPPSSASILFPDGDKLYAGTHSGIFVSDGKLNHWKKVGEGTQAYAPFGLAKSAGKLYAISKEGVFSFDGKSWMILSDPMGEVSNLRAWAMDDRGILVASNQSVFFYDQKTKKWSNISDNLNSDKLKDLQDVYLQNGLLYLALVEKGVLRKKIGDKEWQSLNMGIGKGEKIRGFSQPYQNPMVYTDQDQYLLNSDGKSWKSATYQAPKLIHSIVPYKNTLYAAGETGVFQQVKNGTWESINGGLKTEAVSDFKIINNEIYASSASGLYHFSQDKKQWIHLLGGASQDCQQPIEYMQVLNGKTYLGSYISGILEADLSKDSWKPLGKNWPLQKLPALTVEQLKPCFNQAFESVPFLTDYQNTLAAATLQQVYRLGAGQSWNKWFDLQSASKAKSAKTSKVSDEANPLTSLPSRILGVLGVDKDFYVGTMKGLYRYQDQTKKWQKIPVGTLENTYVSHLTWDEKYFYVETQDERIFKLDLKTQKWEELEPLPYPQTIICEMKQVNGKMWVLGGKGVFAWNKSENKWEEVLKNSVGEKYCPAAAETKDKLFILKQDGLYQQAK